jgi:hypothetical protein
MKSHLLSFFIVSEGAEFGVRVEMELSDSKVKLDLVFACFDDLHDSEEDVFEDVKDGCSRATARTCNGTRTHLNHGTVAFRSCLKWRQVGFVLS